MNYRAPTNFFNCSCCGTKVDGYKDISFSSWVCKKYYCSEACWCEDHRKSGCQEFLIDIHNPNVIAQLLEEKKQRVEKSKADKKKYNLES